MIDLRSDTVTQPSPAMRAIMAAAATGDDVYGEDPTVNILQERAAEITGMEAALFVPSGTMANLIAYLCQTRPGDAVLLHEGAHPYHYEAANAAVVGGLLLTPLPGAAGKLEVDTVRQHICQIDDPHFAHTTLLSLENTTNRGGGAFYTVEEFTALGALAREHGLKVHCDGARIFNAATAAGVDVADYAAHCHSLSFCLSKGLGAPVGSLLCGPRELIKRGLKFRKMLGGGMRQAGILAAAGLYALDHHVADLAEDHRRARQFREALEVGGIRFVGASPTNILYLRVEEHPLQVVGALVQEGIMCLPHDEDQIRVVFHRDIDDQALARAIEIFLRVLGR